MDIFAQNEDYCIVRQFNDIKKFYKYLKQILIKIKKEQKDAKKLSYRLDKE